MRSMCKMLGAFAAGAVLAISGQSTAGVLPGLTTEIVASGLNRPVALTHAPGDFDRVFFLEKRGVMRVIDLKTSAINTVMNIDSIVGGGTSNFSEQGLLGIAFHPQYLTNGYFYLYYINNSGNTQVSRFTMTGDPLTSVVANPATEDSIISVNQDFANHNGGWIGFNPLETVGGNNYLYIALGDGGSGNDPNNRAQTRTNLLGSMLRIDIGDGTSGTYSIPLTNPYEGHASFREEIWAYGLRNPFRNSFDRLTGDMYIGDVGQDAREEVDFHDFANPGGQNYGWKCREGNINTPGVFCSPVEPETPPVQVLVHNPPTPPATFICSVIGGYAYRGCAIPGLEGTYFFADNCGDTVWSFRIDGAGTGVTEFMSWASLANTDIVSFGEDAFGEMYIVSQNGSASGVIRRIIPTAGTTTDCNANSVEDACDILSGFSSDGNMNGIPDECEVCDGDVDGNGVVDVSDIAFVIFRLGDSGAACIDGDADGNGVVDVNDIAYVIFRLATCATGVGVCF